MPLDDDELRIARLLQEDGRLATAEIARRIGVSEPTVRKKLARMMGDGAMRVRLAADPALLGYGVTAYIGLDVERPCIEAVGQKLTSYPFVDSVVVATGPYDIIIFASFESLADLYAFVLSELTRVEGIKDTHSFLVMRTLKFQAHQGVVNRTAAAGRRAPEPFTE